MAKVVELLDSNIKIINKLAQVGVVPLSLLQNYDIYKAYLETKGMPQMKRYSIVSLRYKISISGVRKAISAMDKVVY